MAKKQSGKSEPIRDYGVRNIVDTPWYCGPGHTPQAISKRLVGAGHGSHKLGYVISCYAPGHFIKPHKHKTRDQVYHILEGEGVAVIDGKRHRCGKNDIMFFPAGVEHGFYNEGTQNLIFVIASSPSEED
jgi:mannose-6-phosphate isomerase-like protein (cupin superfamily)